jgi:signal peptidase I
MMFEIILFGLVCLCAVVMLICRFVLPGISKRRPEPWYLDYARSFFPVLLLVFLLRGFVAEPFRIPSGSMLPTLEIGDFILVNKYTYGLRLPITHTKVMKINEPERGDVVVFRYPPNPSQNYIKRLIGLPGDEIVYRYQTLYVNGEEIESTAMQDYIQQGKTQAQNRFEQTIKSGDELGSSVSFSTLLNKYSANNANAGKWVVPAGHYFMMGDNRDNSADSRSRSFTFVPDENIVGEAFFVWMSFGTSTGSGLDVDRIGAGIKATKVDAQGN